MVLIFKTKWKGGGGGVFIRIALFYRDPLDITMSWKRILDTTKQKIYLTYFIRNQLWFFFKLFLSKVVWYGDLIFETHVRCFMEILHLINRPGVADSVLQTPLSLINWVGKWSFSSQSSRHHKSQILRECSPLTMCHMSQVTCHISGVMCQVSHIRCHVL